MAGSLSNYGEDKLLDHVLSITSLTMPANIYAALTTVTITDSMTGATITEATYTGYARIEVLAASLNASSGGVVTNSADIVFAACSGSTSTVIGVAICDSVTTGAGNMLMYSDVTSHVVDSSNTPATIPAGSLSITLT
jgi:hypothetical protein